MCVKMHQTFRIMFFQCTKHAYLFEKAHHPKFIDKPVSDQVCCVWYQAPCTRHQVTGAR